MTVWICESGDYEQRGVDGVYATLDAAVECTKRRFGPPYKVHWHKPDANDHPETLIGDFEGVPGYSTKHTARFDFTEWTVEGDTLEP